MPYKLIVENVKSVLNVSNAKAVLKTMADYVLNVTGINDLNTGTSNINLNKIDWTLQHYTDTAANLTSNNPVLLLGQIGIESDSLTTAPKMKIGDGITAWNTLPYGGGGISLTSLSATSPLVYDNLTGVFSIPVATSSVNGYLSSANWTTFNSKQAALVSGTNIKTINGTSILGSGNLSVGTILGTVGASSGLIPFGNGTLNTVQTTAGFNFNSNILTTPFLSTAQIYGNGTLELFNVSGGYTNLNISDTSIQMFIDAGNYFAYTGAGLDIGCTATYINSTDLIYMYAVNSFSLNTDGTFDVYSVGNFTVNCNADINFTSNEFRATSVSVMTLTSLDAINVTSGAGKDVNIITGTTGILILDTGTTGVVKLGNGAFAKAITIGNVTGATSVNINSGTASCAWTTTNGRFNLITGTGQINIGTDAFGKPIVIGNSTVATSIDLLVGGTLTLNGNAGSIFNFGTSLTTGTITIGGTAQSGIITIGRSSTSQTIRLGISGTPTIQIATISNAGTVSIGTSFTTGTITLGSTIQTGTITLGACTFSSGTSIINIGSGVTTSTNIHQINIGANGVRKDITIGNANASSLMTFGASTHTFNVSGTSMLLMNASRLNINNQIYVGDTSTTPTARLHIKGADTSAATYNLKLQSSTGTETFNVNNNGQVGIGTLPTSNRALTVKPAAGTSCVVELTAVDNTVELIHSYLPVGTINGTNYQWIIGRNTGVNQFALRSWDGTTDQVRILVTSTGTVGIGTASPNANAILDLPSSTKAFLPPRMTTAEKNAIGTPTNGMVVFDSTLGKLCVYSTTWQTITSI